VYKYHSGVRHYVARFFPSEGAKRFCLIEDRRGRKPALHLYVRKPASRLYVSGLWGKLPDVPAPNAAACPSATRAKVGSSTAPRRGAPESKHSKA